ncbi:MAG: hypothetical protein HPPSJP_0620 [Candidatus Hepatoplasma scabrum]|nr:MAG: hypothetical protein HPPSJP_0620 [Candidatus Hepatoplasma sp.]
MHKKKLIRKIIINLIVISFFLVSWSYFFIVINQNENDNIVNEKPIIDIDNLSKSIINVDPFIDFNYFKELWIEDFDKYQLQFEPTIYFGYDNEYIYVKVLDDQKIVFKYEYYLINNQIF